MDLSQKILSDIVVFDKYARYQRELERREIWHEAVDRVKDMHSKRFPQLKVEIEDAFAYVYSKRVMPSMRSIQFGGLPIILNPARIYNCCATRVNHPKTFAEIALLLLGGSGVGWSVQKHHVEQLPEIKKPTSKRRFLIPDSILGWAEAVNQIIKCYLLGYSRPIFDYSDIRPRGSPIKTAGGNAPGPTILMKCLQDIERIFCDKKDRSVLTPLEVHDILCFISEAVVSGESRRSSSIGLFSFDDQEMVEAKSGDWYYNNPQRCRANNSAVILRHKIKKEQFDKYWDRIEKSGFSEPGIFFSNDPEWMTNPSLRKGTRVVTKTGIFPIEELEGKQFKVRNIKREWADAKCFLSGKSKKLYEVKLHNNAVYYCTGEHKWPIYDNTNSLRKVTTLEMVGRIQRERFVLHAPHRWMLYDGHSYKKNPFELAEAFIEAKQFPPEMFTACKEFQIVYLLKLLNLGTIEGFQLEHPQDIIDWLGFLGYQAYYGNGELVIDVSYNSDYPIAYITSIKETDLYEDVWDIHVYDDTHTFQLSHCFTGNCGEISLRPPGQMCNLTEINAATVENQADFNERAKIAAFIGTLQASYTDFIALRDFWKKTCEKEALLGVSMTGICAGKVLDLNIKEAAEVVKKENERIASIIGINPAARATAIKPAGTTSLVLGTSSGIHPYFARYYLRRMRLDKNKPLYSYLKTQMPNLIEDEFYHPSTQAIISIPLKAPSIGIIRSDEQDTDLLARIKRFKQDWILPTHNRGSNTHNVSTTVYVNDWQKVREEVWNNRDNYSGLTFMKVDDSKYIQAPFEEITEQQYRELSQHVKDIDLSKVKEYGDNTNLQGEVACRGGACEVL